MTLYNIFIIIIAPVVGMERQVLLFGLLGEVCSKQILFELLQIDDRFSIVCCYKDKL